MSSDSEEENGMRHGDESDERQSRSPSRPRFHSRSRSQSPAQSNSRSRSRSDSPARIKAERHEMTNVRESSPEADDMQDFKENGARRGSPEDNETRRQVSRSKSPEDNNDAWRGASEKRVSRSRSKSKPKEKEPSKELDRKSGGKKKSRSKRSRSRSRSRRRSHSRSRRSRSRNRRRSRSRSRSRGSRSRRRSRSRSRRRTRSRSRSGTPVDGARLHVAELDVDTRKRDLERVFEKYGRLREIWMARNPPCFAFVVYAHQRDADKALRETDGIMIGHCRIKVTQARPRVRGGRMRGGYDPNLRCYQCGELGHFSRNCTDTKFGYKRPPTPPGVGHSSRQ